MNKKIIRPLTMNGKLLVKEKDYGFMTRTEFINQTGVFVSPFYFSIIVAEFKEQDLSPKAFMKDFIEDNKHLLVTIGEMNCFIDDDEITALGTDHDITAGRTLVDVINDLLIRSWEKQEIYESCCNEGKKQIALIKKMNLQLNIYGSLLLQIYQEKEIAAIIEKNQILTDSCTIALNQLKTLTDEIGQLLE